VILALCAATLAACGGGDSGGSRTLNWYIAFQPGGALQKIADACTQQSEGRYRINIELLPTQADQQREQLVRRLGAEDDAIDIVGMDVVWTGEFANAGWVQEVPADRREALTSGVFDSVLKTGQFEDKQYAVPIWSNTQLLWYRKDRVPKPPETWSEMLDKAEELGPDEGRVQVQANRYEGLVVWANAMIASAGTAIITGPETIGLNEPKTKEALKIMERLGKSDVHAPNIDTSDEGTSALQFENGSSAFMVNYPFVYASAKSNAPEVFKQMGAAKFPKVDPSRDSAPPLGGFNLGVSSYSDKQDLSWDAIECLVGEQNQLTVTSLEGLPPVKPGLFSRKEVQDAYPGFADVIRESIQDASPRPSESPAYADLSLAIQDALHPVTKLDANAAYDKLRDNVEKAIKREGLL
jgi:multiple sugar transport system substrate-binding protein